MMLACTLTSTLAGKGAGRHAREAARMLTGTQAGSQVCVGALPDVAGRLVGRPAGTFAGRPACTFAGGLIVFRIIQFTCILFVCISFTEAKGSLKTRRI